MTRYREEVDLERFQVDHSQAILANRPTQERGWGADGLPTDQTQDPACLAKEVFDPDTGRSRYYAKYCLIGPNAGSMVDPDDETDLRRRGDWTASGRFNFRPVEKLAYDLYVNFLKTRNRAYLRQAEREVTP